MTAAEQLKSVPRFLCDGQIARPAESATQPAITGRRYQGSQPSAQMPLSPVVKGIQSANMGRNFSQNEAGSLETNASDKTITSTEPPTPDKNRARPRCQ